MAQSVVWEHQAVFKTQSTLGRTSEGRDGEGGMRRDRSKQALVITLRAIIKDIVFSHG